MTNDELTRAHRELTNYIFFKTFATWGEKKFDATFSTGQTLQKIKTDWEPDLMQALRIRVNPNDAVLTYMAQARQKIDRVFTDIRYFHSTSQANYQWPCMKTICAHFDNYREEREPDFINAALPPPKKNKKRNAEKGASILADLKRKFNMVKKS